jgi:spore coat polysaccharide biosynthesis predicted glycosyltransferase SpsG
MIVFRCDVSPAGGLRPLRRCSHLAALLKKESGSVICCRQDKQALKFLSGQKVTFTLIKDPGMIDISAARAVVFDLDRFSSQDLGLLNLAKKTGVMTIQIVAAGGQVQAADIVITPGHEPGATLLHHKFRHFHKVKRKYRKKPVLVFVNLGDLLPYRDLRAVVDTLHRLRLRLKILADSSLKKADKRNLMKIYPGIHFCGRSESPARAYFEADLALIPPGDEALEAACVGTPALYLPLGKDQEAMADAWAARGLGVRIPSLGDFSVQSLRDAIAPLTPEIRGKMGAAGKALVDGLGVQRFLKNLKENGIIE